MQFSVNAQGRLQSEEEFRDIVLKSSPDGSITRLRRRRPRRTRCSRIRLRSLLNNKPAIGMGIMQSPGANALDVFPTQVREPWPNWPRTSRPRSNTASSMTRPSSSAPASRPSFVTLLEAIALVVLVVILFLQTWRASIIPLLAVPVSIVGTFALMLGFGFSINALSLFGMVLAIGIVVDDAIVVVENVERNIDAGLTPARPPTGRCAKSAGRSSPSR
jgi:multidrug efflux pump